MKKIALVLLSIVFLLSCEKENVQVPEQGSSLPHYDASNTVPVSWDELPDELKNAAVEMSDNLKASTYKYAVGPWGGSGGGAFAHRPSRGSKIHAIAIRSGRCIDNLKVWYKKSDGTIYIGVDAGGNGGKYHVNYFSGDEYIKKINGRDGRHIDKLSIYTNKKSFSYGGNGGSPFTVSASSSDQILGFYGRSGRLLDRVGFYVYSRN